MLLGKSECLPLCKQETGSKGSVAYPSASCMDALSSHRMIVSYKLKPTRSITIYTQAKRTFQGC